MTIRLFKHYVPLPIVVLAVIESAVLVLAPYLSARILYHPLPWDDVDSVVGIGRALVFAAMTLLCLMAVGLYNPRQRIDFAGQVARVLVGMFVAVLTLAMLYYLVPGLELGRIALLLAIGLAFAGSMLVRLVFHQSVDWERFKRRVLVYGAGRQAASIAALRRRSDKLGFRLVGYVPAEDDREVQVPEGQLLAPRQSLMECCTDHAVDEIVVAMDDRRQGFPMQELLQCRLEGMEVTEVVTFLERESGKVQLDVLNPSWMIFSEGFQRGRVHAALERACDLLAGMALVLIAWPLMLLTAVAIKLEDGARARVLYRQMRVGRYGRPFALLKFRSMAEGAEADGQARWAEANDARMTRVGRIIRRLRFDELPQVFNVLRGDMSLVGPRPERPEFVVELEETVPYYRERHNLKPGITGWAQLCYPYGSSERDAREKLQYDLYYVKNHTLLFYLAILVQTVEIVFWGKGAR